MPRAPHVPDELFPLNHALRSVKLQLISTGRSYRSIALWHRIEYQIGIELGAMAKEVMHNPADLNVFVAQHMNALAERLNLTLG